MIVPAFHSAFEAWANSLGPPEQHNQAGASGGWGVRRREGGGSFKFPATDPLNQRARRVPLREGDVLVWDQRCVHGAAPNDSDQPRYAQFARFFRADAASPARRLLRARAVLRELENGGATVEAIAGPIAAEVLGLGELPPGEIEAARERIGQKVRFIPLHGNEQPQQAHKEEQNTTV